MFLKKASKCKVAIFSLALFTLLTGCNLLPSSGASRTQIENSGMQAVSDIQVIDLTDSVSRELLKTHQQKLFSEVFKDTNRSSYAVGPGDIVQYYIWEAPPAVLFSTASPSMMQNQSGAGASTSFPVSFPEQMVSSRGTINIPFAGEVKVAGLDLEQIENKIKLLLKSKANQPQILVKLIRNSTANVTIVGDVGSSAIMPLTPRGERLLDALAASGGVKQQVSKITLQLTRNDQVASVPLETIIRDPKQNIHLRPGDVLTALYQPLSFTVLGATGKSDEINFEAQGITLAQALARAGGLQDSRADAKGVFIFRFEAPNVMKWPKPVKLTADGKVPVIYRLDLRNPESFFVAQTFIINNKDILYVSNAPFSELQKFLNILLSVISPTLYVANTVGN